MILQILLSKQLFLLNLTNSYLCNQNTFKMAKNKEFKGYFEGDNLTQIKQRIEDLRTYKLMEKNLMAELGLLPASFTTLVMMCYHYMLTGEGLSARGVLRSEGKTVSDYHATMERLAKLSRRDLVNVGRGYKNSYCFTPTKNALDRVSRLLL